MFYLYFNESIKVPKFRFQIALNYIYFITLMLIGFMFGTVWYTEWTVVQAQHFDEVNQGRCGECGDELARPRPNDEGGLYGTEKIWANKDR
jgi:hypothetical protein